jgi:hypothetical protein
MGFQPFARPLTTHRTTQTQDKSTHTSGPRVGFYPTNTVHAIDLAGTVIGSPGPFAQQKCELFHLGEHISHEPR